MKRSVVPHSPQARVPQLALALALALAPKGAHAQHSWRPEERVMVSAFHEVAAVALDPWRVFAATAHGLTIYDRMAERWALPLTVEDGYPAWERPTALAHQRFGDVLWLGTAAGTLYRLDVAFGRWESVAAPAQGPIMELVTVDDLRDDAVYIRSTSGWSRLRSGDIFADPVAPGELPPAVRAIEAPLNDPAFLAMRGTLSMDADGRHWPFTDFAHDPRTDEVWLGSDGGNVVRADPRMMRSERLVYGTVSAGAGAVAFDGTSMWFGGDGRGARRGVSVADETLQRWTHFEPFHGAPAGRVSAILADGAVAWVGASDGLYRLDRDAARWSRFTDADGLPATDVTALVRSPAGIWVGTARGLAYVDARATPVAVSRQRVHGLALAADTLWIASEAGLVALPLPQAGDTVPPSPVLTGLRGRVLGVAFAFGALHAISDNGVYRRSAAGWEGPIREPGAAGVGRLTRIVGFPGALWVAGAEGVARAEYPRDPSLLTWTMYRTPADIPQGPVYDVLPMSDHVWLATPLGALRLEVSR